MKYTKGKSLGWLGNKLKTQFLTGILVAVPIGATILILAWIFNAIDNILQPATRFILGYTIPGIHLFDRVICDNRFCHNNITDLPGWSHSK